MRAHLHAPAPRAALLGDHVRVLLALAANTRSGSGTDPDRLARLLARGGAHVEPIEMADLADGLPDGTERMVVAGGDGSIGPAAAAAHAARVPLAVVPTGTANDFARGLPSDVEAACPRAADPAARTRRQEVGTLGGRPFVNAAAAGLSAVASRYAAPLKPRLGAMAYGLGAVGAGLTASPWQCRVRCDGGECFSGAVWQVVVGATGAFGAGSAIGGIRPDDGALDVAVVPGGPRLTLLRRAVGMRRGSLISQSDVAHHRGREVEIDLPPGTAFNVDGDLRECHQARFALLPGGVAVVVP
jgi:diacylglycerol kinase (ATP)